MKSTLLKNSISLIVLCGVSVGCAGMSFQRVPVAFESPYEKLSIALVEPTREERQGVLLHVTMPPEKVHHYREESTIFARIKDTKGLKFDFIMNRTDTYTPGTEADAFILHSETEIERKGGTLVEELELTPRGEIVRFIHGSHKSDIGTFDIQDWTRTPVFPGDPVKIGEVWTYEEVMDVRLKSFWVKDSRPEPYVIKAMSTLAGFAVVNNKRCAVIETKATQRKHQYLKALFRELDFIIHADITEQTYLEYATGTVIARVTTTKSHTTSRHSFLNDTGESQSIVYVVTDR